MPPDDEKPADDEEHPREQLRGPVVLRRDRRNESTTTDQRLLDSRGPSDWVHTDPWRVLRIQSEFVEGFGMLAELPRAVTVFGSARTGRDHPEYAAGRELGAALAGAGFAVITGGGPGTMEAANRGASEAGGLSVGLGIELPFEQGLNPGPTGTVCTPGCATRRAWAARSVLPTCRCCTSPMASTRWCRW